MKFFATHISFGHDVLVPPPVVGWVGHRKAENRTMMHPGPKMRNESGRRSSRCMRRDPPCYHTASAEFLPPSLSRLLPSHTPGPDRIKCLHWFSSIHPTAHTSKKIIGVGRGGGGGAYISSPNIWPRRPQMWAPAGAGFQPCVRAWHCTTSPNHKPPSPLPTCNSHLSCMLC